MPAGNHAATLIVISAVGLDGWQNLVRIGK